MACPPFRFAWNRKRHPGPHETASWPCRQFGKTVANARRPVKKKSIVVPGAPSLDRCAFADGGNRPNDPFNRIPYYSPTNQSRVRIVMLVPSPLSRSPRTRPSRRGAA
jgi:hypothetical protein